MMNFQSQNPQAAVERSFGERGILKFAIRLKINNFLIHYIIFLKELFCGGLTFSGKFGVPCFLEISVLRFALLPYYRRSHLALPMP